MKSRLPILALLLVTAAALVGLGLFVAGSGSDGGAESVAVGPSGPSGAPAASDPGAESGTAGREAAAEGGRSAAAAATPERVGGATQAAAELTDSVELGPDEALLEVELRAIEGRTTLPEVTLLLLPEDDLDLGLEPAGGSLARLGQTPYTDAGGRAQFVVPAGRTFVLRASARSGVSGPAETKVPGLAPGERSRVVLRVPTELDRAFYGRVVDAASQEPIADARVLVRHQGARRLRGRVEDTSETRETLRTAERGTFDVRVPSWESLYVRVESPGYAPAIVPIDDAAGGADTARTIALQRAAALSVRVVDEHGEPLEGRVVQLRTEERVLLQQDGAAPSVGSTEADWTATTGSDGSVSFEDLPPDAELYLEAYERGSLVLHEPGGLRIPAGERLQRELILAQGLSLTGRVLDRRGWPVPRLELWLLSARSESSPYVRRYDKPVAKTVTSTEGRFAFPDVGVGLWTVAPSPAFPSNVPLEERIAPVGTTFRIDERTAEDDANRPEREIVVERGLYIAGRVVDGQDVALPDVRVSCTALEAGYALVGATDEEGRFEIGPLSDDEFRLVAEPKDRSVSSRVVTRAGSADLKIVIGSGGVVAGRVVDPAGVPLAAELTIESTEDPDDPRLQRAATEDGTFRFENNAPGTYAVVARTEDGRIGIARELVLEKGATLADVRLEVARGGKVTVVWDERDVPWMCTAELDGLLVSFAVNEKGGTADLTVPAGRLKIGYASEALNRWGETFVDVAAGQTREVTVP